MPERHPAHQAAGSRGSDPAVAVVIIFLSGSLVLGLALGVVAGWLRGLL